MDQLFKVQRLNLVWLKAKNIEAGRARIQSFARAIHHQSDIGGTLGNRPIPTGTDLRHQA